MTNEPQLANQGTYWLFDLDQYILNPSYLRQWLIVWDCDVISSLKENQPVKILLKWQPFGPRGYLYETPNVPGWSSQLTEYVQDLANSPIFRDS